MADRRRRSTSKPSRSKSQSRSARQEKPSRAHREKSHKNRAPTKKNEKAPPTSTKVYIVPPPKNNLQHITSEEMYPVLGGYTHTLPDPISAPLSRYNTALAKTPKSTSYNRIIPFDCSTSKFVYGAIQDKIFKKKYDRAALRSKMLREFDKSIINKIPKTKPLPKLPPNEKHYGVGYPSKSYNMCFCVLLIFLAFFFLVTAIFLVVYWDNFTKNWYWWLLVIVLILAIAFGICCIVRASHNTKTLERYNLLEEIAGEINRKYLRGIGSKVIIGDEGAWMAVEMDPRRTKVRGDVILD